MWIRSQDGKVLLKSDGVEAVDDTPRYGAMGTIETTSIHGLISTEYMVLGQYETTERTIEIIDEIQNYLDNLIDFERQCQYGGHNINGVPKTFVFQMPEK